MVNFATLTTDSIPHSANAVELEATGASTAGEVRCQRIQGLRQAIERGQYRISAGDLADAIFRAVRQAN